MSHLKLGIGGSSLYTIGLMAEFLLSVVMTTVF